MGSRAPSLRTQKHFLAAMAIAWMSSPLLLAQTATAPVEALPPGWEEIDERLVFLTVQLSADEASLSAVRRALAGARYQQGAQGSRAEALKGKNQAMDRQGGGPVPWDKFYGTTALNFYYHPSVSIHAMGNDATRVDIEKSGAPLVPIQRPPQFNYIYKANTEAARNAESDAAAYGHEIDKLTRRRVRLEEDQSALWCKISFRAISSRDVLQKPIYQFEPAGLSDPNGLEEVAALSECRDFIRRIDRAVEQAQKDVDQDQAKTYETLSQIVAQVHADLRKAIVKLVKLHGDPHYDDSPLARFLLAAKRMEESSLNMSDAYRLSVESEADGDQGRRDTLRGELQRSLIDFAKTQVTANQCLTEMADQWKVAFDQNRSVNAVLLPGETLSPQNTDTRLSEKQAPAAEKHESASAPPTLRPLESAPEAARIIDEIRLRYSDVVKGYDRMALLRFHESADFHRHFGRLVKNEGSYSADVVAGQGGFIFLFGIYEVLEPGDYLVVYRAKLESKVDGDNLAFLDVCRGGNTIASRRPKGPEWPSGEWRALPVLLKLGRKATVEYRLWNNDHAVVLDRVYVFKLTAN